MRSIIFLALAGLAMLAGASAEKKIVCYFENWSVYRKAEWEIKIEDIDSKLCTHMIYAFVGLKDHKIEMFDKWADINLKGFARFNALRDKNPNLKTLVAIGGWNENTPRFSKMVSSAANRKIFIDSVVAFLKEHNFNGLDLDWEYPGDRDGASPKDKENFVALAKELKAAFNGKYLLSAAVGVTEKHIAKSYNVPAISKYLDFINLMAYDFHNHQDGITGLHSALFSDPSEKGDAAKLNIDAIVKYWISQGAAKEKLILGIPMYGRSYKIGSNGASVGSKAMGPGTAGPLTKEGGMLAYAEICMKEKNDNWQVKFDGKRRTPYAYKGDQWVGFENVQSVQEKAIYVQKNGLGGAMIWAIDQDDYNGLCGAKYPLITAIHEVLGNGRRVETNEVDSDLESDDESDEEPDNDSDEDPSPSDEDESGEDIPVENELTSGDVPTVPRPVSNDGICTEAGDTADPSTCKQFIKCVAAGDGTFIPYTMSCPEGLCYKPEIGVCDWE